MRLSQKRKQCAKISSFTMETHRSTWYAVDPKLQALFLRPLYFIEYAFLFHFHIYDYIWKHWSGKYNNIVDKTRSMCFYSMPWLHFQIRLCATLFGRQQYIIIIIKYITLCIISVADIIVYFKLSTDIVLLLSLERCWRRSWVAKL